MVAFLVTILVVSDVCARAGVFEAAAQRVGRWSGGSAVRLFTGVFVLAAVVTATLSLDATVVLLTPVVLAAGMARSVPDEPGTYACLRMANSASLLLPVSNLTNLLALPHLDLTFTGFALRMAPVLGGRAGRGVRRAAPAVPRPARRDAGRRRRPPATRSRSSPWWSWC